MFIRWKDRQLQDSDCTVTAVLVRSQRIAGRPRQQFIAHLGSIRQGLLEHDSHCLFRADFWKQVEAQLDRVAEPMDRPTIEAAIARRVPRPSPDEIERDRIEVQRLRGEYAGLLAK